MTQTTRPRPSASDLGLGAVFLVLVVVGLAIGRLSPDEPSGGPARAADDAAAIVDDFARADTARTISSGGQRRWIAARGVWGIRDEAAYVVSAPGGVALAVIDAGWAEGSVQTRLSQSSNGAGLVFRYRDPANYWAFVVAPPYATWTIERTVGGRRTVVGNTGLSPIKAGTVAAVRMGSQSVEFVLDGKVRRRIDNAILADATHVGLVGRGAVAGRARWDSFRAIPAPISAVPKQP